MMRFYVALAALAMITLPAMAADVPPPVAEVVDGRLSIGDAQLPVFVSQDWTRPLPALGRAVIVIHGYQRNAADYARNMMALTPPGDTLVVAPQFLAAEDITAHALPDAVLRWDREQWSDGDPAEGPAPLSAFEALDAILAKLSDRTIFPNLSEIVLAGFSAGGQFVQRYATVGKGDAVFGREGLGLRYVIGSPGTFAYFGDERPQPDGTITAFAGAAACPEYNRWKFGFSGNLPPYVAAGVKSFGLTALEHRYARRDIAYLVGGNDNDPNHRFLNTSCAAEAQGPTRLARMRFFFADMRQRNADILRHRLRIVDGAAHNEARVLGSECGRAALFGDGGCSAQEGKK